jgi:ribonuclease BN (tRNA processing enzyme)
MIIRCWGSRGSIPVSGRQYLRYGGNTTCLEIRTKNDEILIIDAGSGIRELGNSLVAKNRHSFTLLLTHAHWDHIMGFPFLKPIYSHETNLTIWGCPLAQISLKEMLSRTMAPPNFPINFDSIRANMSYQVWGINLRKTAKVLFFLLIMSWASNTRADLIIRPILIFRAGLIYLSMMPNLMKKNINKLAAGGILFTKTR